MSSPLPQEKKWSLTQEAFDRLLSCLDVDREHAGDLYIKLRGKLISYFSCRDCPFPEDHADETINRVARKLESGGEIRELSTYVYGVARLLLLEILKERGKRQAAIEHLSRTRADSPTEEDEDERLACFNRCLPGLNEEDRCLITKYYEGEQRVKIENRERLAQQLGISQNALRIRAYRLRMTVEKCVSRCMRGGAKKS
ncbi:MAG: RNA polymerase sigma factor [Blastocatellia bacterium]